MSSSPIAWLDVSMEDLFPASSDDSDDEMLILNDAIPSQTGDPSSIEDASSNRQRPDTPMPSFSPSVDDSVAVNANNLDRLVLLTSDESGNSDVEPDIWWRAVDEIEQRWRTPDQATTTATFAPQSSPEPGPSHRRSTRSSTNRPISREPQPQCERHGNRHTAEHDCRCASMSAKRKRRSSAAERSTQPNRHRKRNIHLPDPVDSDSDVEVVASSQRGSSDAVGETTLANIRQMESDELLARQLQSMFDNSRTGSGRSSSSGGPAARRSNNYRRHRRPPPPPPPRDVTILDGFDMTSSSPFPGPNHRERQRRSERNTPVASRTRSARQTYANFLDALFLSDDDLEPIDELFANPRAFGSGRIRSTNPNSSRGLRAAHFESADTFLTAFFDEDEQPAVARNNYNNRNQEVYHYRLGQLLRHNPGVFGDEIIELDFENILNIADRVGDASTGLKAVEITAFTTQKSYSTSASSETNDTCTICMTDFAVGENLTVLPCLHDFHEPCVGRWLQTKPTCPICRVDVRA